MPTIYFVIDAPYGFVSNGRVNWLYNLAEQFNENKSDFNVHIICRRPTNRKQVYNLEKHNSIKITTIPFSDTNNIPFRILDKVTFRFFNLIRSYYFSFISALIMLKSKENDFVFGLNPGFEVLPGIILRRALKKKINITCVMKGLFAEEQFRRLGYLESFFLKLEYKTLKECNIIFCNGFDSKKYIKEKHNLDAKILPNGVNTNEFFNIDTNRISTADHATSEKYKHIKNIGESKKIIMQVGSITEYKGIDYLLDATAEIAKFKDDFVVVLIGKGAKNSKYEETIHRHQLGDKVCLIDEVPSEYLKYFLDLADVVTNLSVFGIGFSMATLESLALSKINIAWDNIIYNQFLTNSEVVFVENKNAKSLANAIIEVSYNPDKYENLKNNGRNKSLLFDWHNIYKNLIKSVT